MPPSYFIPLTLVFPATTAWLTSLLIVPKNIRTAYKFSCFLPLRLNHKFHVPFHIFPPIITVTTYKREIITKFQLQNCSLDFSSLIACLFALHVFAPVFQQLTKLHQLAMQQSPFPIAHGNQGCFQGRSTDWKHLLSICNSRSHQHTHVVFVFLQLGWTPLHRLTLMRWPFQTM